MRYKKHFAVDYVARVRLVRPRAPRQPSVRELILRGCNPNTGSGTGETALHTMAAHGQVDCARTLKALSGAEFMVQPKDKVGYPCAMTKSRRRRKASKTAT